MTPFTLRSVIVFTLRSVTVFTLRSVTVYTNNVLACTAATVESVLSFLLLLCQNPLCRVQMCGFHDAHSSIPVPNRNHFRGPFCISTLLAVHGGDGGGGWRQIVGSLTGRGRQIVGSVTGRRRQIVGSVTRRRRQILSLIHI